MSKIDEIRQCFIDSPAKHISLIADMGVLLDHIDSLERDSQKACQHCHEVQAKYTDLEQKLAKAKSALEFYANETSWWWKSEAFGDLASRIIGSEDISTTEACVKDGCGGKLARTTLAEIGEK